MGYRIAITEKGHALRKEFLRENRRETSRTPSPMSKLKPLTSNIVKRIDTSFLSKSPTTISP